MSELLEEARAALWTVWNRRWLALGVAWGVCVLGWLIVALIPNTYESEARVFIQLDDMLADQIGITAASRDKDIERVRQTLTSAVNLEKIVRSTRLGDKVTTPGQMAAAVADLGKNIKVVAQGDKGANLFQITADSGHSDLSDSQNSQLAQDIAQQMIDIFKEQNLGGSRSEMRDTMGLLLLQQGVDISKKFSDADYEKAIDTLTKEVNDGQIRNIKGNSYLNDLKSGDTLAAICWSGDITQLNAEAGDNWQFAIPEAGGTLWSDNFVIPIGSPRKANAEKLIDYYYQPEVAAEVAAWVNYITPVEGAKEAAVKIDPELADNQLIFPDADTLSQVKVFRTLSPAEEQKFQAAFQKVILGA